MLVQGSGLEFGPSAAVCTESWLWSTQQGGRLQVETRGNGMLSEVQKDLGPKVHP